MAILALLGSKLGASGVHAIVFTGAGRPAFSAGMNIAGQDHLLRDVVNAGTHRCRV
jgi:enoyl-CoA hydratase/carnithine racemase